MKDGKKLLKEQGRQRQRHSDKDKGKEMKDEGHTNVLYCTKQRPLYIIIFVHNCSHASRRKI
jgi:hypothetical protein